MNNQIIVNDFGKNNKLIISKNLEIALGHKLAIDIKGDNNLLIIKSGQTFQKSLFNITGNCNTLILNDNCQFSGSISLINDNNNVYIDMNNSFKGTDIRCEYGCSITIGRSCIFEKNTIIRTGDSHSIISIQTGSRLNNCESICIGNHVLCCRNSAIFRDSQVLNDSVIASNSLVNKKFLFTNILIAGTPAVIKRKEINWDINENLYEYISTI